MALSKRLNYLCAVTHPYPGAFSFSGGEKVTVWKARLVSSDFNGDALDFFDGKLELLRQVEIPIQTSKS